MEELITRIKGLNIGIEIEGKLLSILIYADDIILLTESEEDMIKALACTRKFGEDCDMIVSQTKSKILIAGTQPNDNPVTVYGLEVVKDIRYLGLTLDKNGFHNNMEKKVTLSKQWLGRMGAEARFHSHSNQIIRDSWKVLAVPQIMYGMEIIQSTNNLISELETVQNRIGKLALNAGNLLTTVANRGEMGWSTFRSRMARTKLKFKAKLDLADPNSWVSIMYKTCEADPKLMNSFNSIIAEYKIKWDIAGQEISINSKKLVNRINIKNRIDKIIINEDLRKWKEEIDKKKSLTIYKEKKAPTGAVYIVEDQGFNN